jgi:hypothetical protein
MRLPGAEGDPLLQVGVCRSQHLHQARFANTRLAAEQHHLADPLLDLRPALQEQADCLRAPHQRGQPRGTDCLQATAGRALIQHAIDRQRLGETFEERGA